RAAVIDLGHEGPFEAGGEAGTAAAAEARGLDLVGDPVAALLDEALGAGPGAALARALEAPVALTVEIGEDAILVGEHVRSSPLARVAAEHAAVFGDAAVRQRFRLADPVVAGDAAAEIERFV